MQLKMKWMTLLFALVAVFSLASCKKENEPKPDNQDNQEKVIEGTIWERVYTEAEMAAITDTEDLVDPDEDGRITMSVSFVSKTEAIMSQAYGTEANLMEAYIKHKVSYKYDMATKKVVLDTAHATLLELVGEIYTGLNSTGVIDGLVDWEKNTITLSVTDTDQNMQFVLYKK